MRKIKVVVLLVRQLQHGFTKIAKVSPYLTVAQMDCDRGTWGKLTRLSINHRIKSFVISSQILKPSQLKHAYMHSRST